MALRDDPSYPARVVTLPGFVTPTADAAAASRSPRAAAAAADARSHAEVISTDNFAAFMAAVNSRGDFDGYGDLHSGGSGGASRRHSQSSPNNSAGFSRGHDSAGGGGAGGGCLLYQSPVVGFTHPLTVGTLVEARYASVTWYPGRIDGVNADGTYNVGYEDGDRSPSLPQDRVRPRSGSRQAFTLRLLGRATREAAWALFKVTGPCLALVLAAAVAARLL